MIISFQFAYYVTTNLTELIWGMFVLHLMIEIFAEANKLLIKFAPSIDLQEFCMKISDIAICGWF